MKILKRVESGEISPDVAVELIEALGSLDDSDGVGEAVDELIRRRVESGEISPDAAAELTEAFGGIGNAERAEGDSTDEVDDSVDAVASSVDEFADRIAEAVDRADEIADSVDEVVDWADEIADRVDEAVDRVEEFVDSVDEVVDRVVDEVVDRVDEIADSIGEDVGRVDEIADGTVSFSLDGVFDSLGSALSAIGRLFRNGDVAGGSQYVFTDTREGAFGVDRPQLDFSFHNGSVSLQGWDKPTYSMEIKRMVWASTEDEARQWAKTCFEVIDSSDRLAVREIERREEHKAKLAVSVFVPSDLLYNANVSLHNGSVSSSKLTMGDCVMHQHNGKIKIEQVSANKVEATAHNGDTRLSEVDAENCIIRSHNGRIIADVTSNKCEMSAHNGQIRLRVSPKSELTSSVTVYNGSISLDLERADDIGYRVEYHVRNGVSRCDAVRDALEQVSPSEARYEKRLKKWSGQSADYDSKPRKASARCEVYNGHISIGWIS